MKLVQKIITPKDADVLLKKNYGNRKLSRYTIKKYAQEIESGNWRLTGDTIKIGSSGKVIDGQHRLAAIVLANKPIETIMAYDVDERDFDVIDSGKKRNAADCLHVIGVGSASTLVTGLKAIHLIETTPNLPTLRDTTRYSNTQILELYNQYSNKGIDEPLLLATPTKSMRKVITPAVIFVCSYFFMKKDPHLCREFFKKLNSGENLAHDDVILHLRNKLIEDRTHVTKTGGQKSGLSVLYSVGAIVRAWNYIRKNETYSKYRLHGNTIPEIL